MNSMEEKCRHFNGIQHKECRAGVPYMSVRDESQGPYRWPCLRLPAQRECRTKCAKLSILTREELLARRAEMSAAIEAAIAGKCPQCGMELEKQENHNVVVQVCAVHGFVSRGCKHAGGQ